jgi:hypothetical protein
MLINRGHPTKVHYELTIVSYGAILPHHAGMDTPGSVIAKKITIVDRIRPVSSPAAVM